MGLRLGQRLGEFPIFFAGGEGVIPEAFKAQSDRFRFSGRKCLPPSAILNAGFGWRCVLITSDPKFYFASWLMEGYGPDV